MRRDIRKLKGCAEQPGNLSVSVAKWIAGEWAPAVLEVLESGLLNAAGAAAFTNQESIYHWVILNLQSFSAPKYWDYPCPTHSFRSDRHLGLEKGSG